MTLIDVILELQIPRIDEVYYPSDDTYLIIDYFDSNEFIRVLEELSTQKQTVNILDMGCGTGILGYCLVYQSIKWGAFQKLDLTYADINLKAIETTQFLMRENFHHFKKLKKFSPDLLSVKYCLSDLFENIPPKIYDLVVFNPPYLPLDDDLRTSLPIDQALYGGSEGISVLKTFFLMLESHIHSKSLVYFITSSLGTLELLIPSIENKYNLQLLQDVHMFFEDIALFQVIKCENT